MDFGQEYYDMFGTQSGERIPFYMTYPMRNSFLEEAEYDRDCQRLQTLYPRDARRIQEVVSRECDKMEHEGSMMFDEYPDRLSVRMLARKIYREIWNDAGNGVGWNSGMRESMPGVYRNDSTSDWERYEEPCGAGVNRRMAGTANESEGVGKVDVSSMQKRSPEGTTMSEQGKVHDREQFGNCEPGRCRPGRPDAQDPMMQLVEVMLMQEMYRRRCRHRRCRRWY